MNISTPSDISSANDANVPLSSSSATTTLTPYPGTNRPSIPIYDVAEWAISDKPIAFREDGSTTDDMSGIKSVKIIWPTIPPLSGFSALPNELQDEIARFALPAPQIIVIHDQWRDQSYGTRPNRERVGWATYQVLGGAIHPYEFVSVSVCFRDVFWRNYRWLFLHESLESMEFRDPIAEAKLQLPKVLLDPNRDIVVLDIGSVLVPGIEPYYMRWLDISDLKHLGIKWNWRVFDVPYEIAPRIPIGMVLPWEIAVKFPQLSRLRVILGPIAAESHIYGSQKPDYQFFDIDTQLADVIKNEITNRHIEETDRQQLKEELERLSRVAAKVRESYNEAINTQPALHSLKKVELKIVITTWFGSPRPQWRPTLHVVPKNPSYHGVAFSVEKLVQSYRVPSWLRFKLLRIDQICPGHAASIREDGTFISDLDFLDDIRYLWD